MTSLSVKWDPADGVVRQYKIFYVPAAGGTEDMVGLAETRSALGFVCLNACVCLIWRVLLGFIYKKKQKNNIYQMFGLNNQIESDSFS